MDDARRLFEYLAERDQPCPGCGYNLRGLPGTRCPECNQELVLSVRLAEPRMVAWITGLVGLCFGVGFSGLLVCYMITQIAMGRGPAMMDPFLVLTVLPLVVESIPLALWIGGRRRVQRLRPPTRVVLVVVFWLLTLVNFVCFTALIR